jgi:hypothetical protein
MNMAAVEFALSFHGAKTVLPVAAISCERSNLLSAAGRLAAAAARTTVKKKLFTSVSARARIGALIRGRRCE